MKEKDLAQLNIKVSKELHSKLKFLAQNSDKTMEKYINSILKQSAEVDFIDDGVKSSVIEDINKRLTNLEKVFLGNNINSVKGTAFTDQEAKNCTLFMKGLFNKIFQERNYTKINQCWKDFIPLVEKFSQWNHFYTLRLKEVMLIEDPDPWTGDELNELCLGNKCPCPIYSALREWSGCNDFPTQQSICDKGSDLVDSIEIK